MKKHSSFKKISLCLVVCVFLVGCGSLPSQANEEAQKKNAAAANFNVQLGMGYLAQGDIQRSKRKLLLALQQAPDWPQALDAMAYFLEKTGEPKKAEQYYLKAVKIAPHDGSALNNYGTFLCRSGHYSEANKQFIRAVQDPNYLSVAEAYENAGLCSLKIPDNNLASRYFDKAVLQDSQRPTAILELADLRYQQGDYLSANDYLRRYFNLLKPGPRVLLLKVRVAQKLGDRATAAQYSHLLKQQFPDSKESKQLGTVGQL